VTRAPAPNVSIDLGDTTELDIKVSVAPYFSILAMLSDAVAGMRRGLPAPLRRNIWDSLRGSSRTAVAPIGTPGQSILPDCVVPLMPRSDIGWQAFVDHMRSSSRQSVVESIEREFNNEIPEHWAAAAENPRKWMTRFADAIVDSAGQTVQPLLARATPIIDREMERVGRAAVHDGVDLLLNNLCPRLSSSDGHLKFFDIQPGSYELAGRSLVLVPMLAGDQLLLSNVDCPDVVWIGYPLPGAGQLWQAPPPIEDTDTLGLLMGVPRAAILRFLSRPSTMGEVAVGLQFAPNTITFHCNHLERTGLVARERHGKQVQISRTDRADQLIDLMS
jgi:hypothetical protein